MQGGHFFGFGGSRCNEQTGERCRVQGESMRFLPSSLDVPKGELVHFVLGFHTATLLPGNTDVSKWVEDNATGVGEPWNLLAPDPDADVAGGPVAAHKFNPQVLFPSPPGCGDAQANPCVHDGTSVTNSGVPFAQFPGSFWVKVDANVGDTVWVLCLVHPKM